MKYYDSSELLEIFSKACAGNKKAKVALAAVEVPHAVTDDFSAMVAVQRKHSVINESGLIRVLNMQPDEGAAGRQAVDIFQCSNDGACSWSSVPVPACFDIIDVKCEGGVFTFAASDGRSIAAAPLQMIRAMSAVVFELKGAAESEIEKAFFSIPQVATTPRQPEKTSAANPPVKIPSVGAIEFDEKYQCFSGKYRRKPYSFTLTVDTSDRKALTGLIPSLSDIIRNIADIDSRARKYAASELLELKNDTWLEDGEDMCSEDDFMARMSIETLSFSEDGDFEIYYEDGDLFWGHSIKVDITGGGKIERAEICG